MSSSVSGPSGLPQIPTQMPAVPRPAQSATPQPLAPVLNQGPTDQSLANTALSQRSQFDPSSFQAPQLFMATTNNHDGVNYQEILNTPLTTEEAGLRDAILNYPGRKCTDQEAHIIARITRLASDHFNLDPKIALAVFAHESVFDDDASNGGGTGLGQLTKPAIEEVYQVGVKRNEVDEKDKKNYTRHRSETRRQLSGEGGVNTPGVFRRLFSDRNLELRKDVHDNIWTSIAYLRTRMDAANTRGDTVNTRTMLAEYNNNTKEPAIKKAYPGKVAAAYQQLWGHPMPATIQNGNAR